MTSRLMSRLLSIYPQNLVPVAILIVTMTACDLDKKQEESASRTIVNDSFKLKWLNERWAGELFYHHIEKSFRVSIFLADGKLKVNYPDKKCTSVVKVSNREKSGVVLKEVSMQGSCKKTDRISLTFYKNRKILLNKDFHDASDVDMIYMQYLKKTESGRLVSGWLEKT